MTSQFRMRDRIEPDRLDWGQSRWLCHPASTGAGQLAALDAGIAPGKGHGFHRHPRQEELLYVLEGRVEQWIARESRILEAGDAVFIAAGAVHASFNIGATDARVIAVFGPSIGDGFEVVDVSSEVPWRDLRG